MERLRRLAKRIPASVVNGGLVVCSLLVSGFIFVKVDQYYTSRHPFQTLATGGCWIPDPILHHALKPNCDGSLTWGRDHYLFQTNNLGLRDEQVRDVPLTTQMPRVLLLGDSFTQGTVRWQDTFAAMIAARIPQISVLNGGISSYSPSNYLNLARRLLAAGLQFDEAIVFMDISDIQDEAAYYSDNPETGGVTGTDAHERNPTWYSRLRIRLALTYSLTDFALSCLEHLAIRSGFYFKPIFDYGNVFDFATGAWTYRPVSDTRSHNAGYAPLGLAAGIVKAQAKMSLLHEELARRGIPLSVVVYPWPGQIAHDVVESRQVTLWRAWCEGNCKRFVSLFPQFFAIKDACPWYAPGCWYDHFIFGDFHFNALGNKVVSEAVVGRLLEDPPQKLPHN